MFAIPPALQGSTVSADMGKGSAANHRRKKEPHDELQICAAGWNLDAMSVASRNPELRRSGLGHGRGAELSAAE
jgi:hypothetical protein